jgi:hypothetical protein
MLPASADSPTPRTTWRKWGPLATVAVVALVVGGIILLSSGNDDDAGLTTAGTEAPGPADTAPPVTEPTSTEPPSGTDPAATDVSTSVPAGERPDVLTFSAAAELGIDVEWGERCDTDIGRVATPDYFRPECYAPFDGDNGGATAPGVTADTIKIVYYQGPDADPIIRYITDAIANDETNGQDADTVAGMIEYFETYYETYGRTVELIPFEGTGIASDEVAARADAVRIAEEIEPFMVWGGPVLTNAFADELAARGVLCLSCTPSQPPDWYEAREPLIWGIDANTGQKQAHGAEFVLRQLAGRPAEFAGDEGFTTTDRRFGLLYLESSATSKDLADQLTATLAADGVELAETIAYALDPASIQQTASQAIAKLKEAGVTTVLFSGDPVAPRDFTREATAQQYSPEWVLVAPTLVDTAAFARTYDQDQWSHAFGITSLAARIRSENSGYYRIYRWFHGEEPASPIGIGVLAPLPAVFYSTLQDVGPDLTRDAWAAALADGLVTTPAITQPSLAWGDIDFWPFHDHNGIDDATLIWWDPVATGPDEVRRDGQGMWQYADGGTRYLPGTWPEDSGLFDAATSVAIFDTPPPEEAPPDYPSPAG